MPKRLITERDIEDAARRGSRSLPADQETLVTPAAFDAARRLGVELSSSPARNPAGTGVSGVETHHPKDPRNPHASTIVALGADHGGFQLKEILKSYLLQEGYTVIDVGTKSEQTCDYPDFAYAVAVLVSSKQASRGIMIDGVGVASAIVANKVPSIRAVPCFSEFVAHSSREHNDANVLTLGGRVIGSEAAKSIVKVWLNTRFGGGRHQQRLQKIQDIEKKNMGGS
jgi:ribose 5-phosphate isomerase B